MKKLLSMLLCLALCIGVMAMVVSADSDTYVVAGTENLCGVEWNATYEGNKMTPNADATVYTKVFENVAVGNYEFKVVKNGSSWIPDGSNVKFSVQSACDVTVTYTVSTGEITVTGSGIGEGVGPVIENMCIVGEGLDCLDWEPANYSVKMTKTAEGVYEYTFTAVQSDWVKIKMAANGNWNDYNVGGTFAASGAETNAVVDSQSANIEFAIPEISNVTVKLDLTGLNYTAGTGAKFTVTITPVSTEGGNENEGGSETTGTITVHAKVPSGWTTACAYVWNGTGTDNTWPGVTMTLGKDGWYTAEVPAWAKYIIIDNGSNEAQTQDITLAEGEELWIVVEATDSGVVGTLTYEAPKTGDSTNLIAVCAAMLLTGAAVVTTVAGKKRFF